MELRIPFCRLPGWRVVKELLPNGVGMQAGQELGISTQIDFEHDKDPMTQLVVAVRLDTDEFDTEFAWMVHEGTDKKTIVIEKAGRVFAYELALEPSEEFLAKFGEDNLAKLLEEIVEELWPE